MQLVITPEVSEKIMERLVDSGFFNRTCRRYDEHLKACNDIGIAPEPFERFALDVLSTPAHNRASLFDPPRETDESEYELRDLTAMYKRMASL